MKKRIFSAIFILVLTVAFSTVAFAISNGDVLYNKDGIKITYQGYEIDRYGDFDVKVLIQNNSNRDICVQVRNESVNGFAFDAIMSDDVDSGQSVYTDITFDSYDLEKNFISKITDLSFSFCIFEWDSEWSIDSEMINIHYYGLNLYNNVSADTRASTVFYNKNGIKISYFGYGFDKYDYLNVNFYVENNSGRNIRVMAMESSVNGKETDLLLGHDILNTKKAYVDMTVHEDDLHENGIYTINEIVFSLLIFDNDLYSSVGKVELFKITPQGISNIGDAAKAVTVSIPTFPVTINGTVKDNSYAQYPYIVYNNITYFPMTYHGSRFLGLDSFWTEENGLSISKTESAGSIGNGDNTTQSNKNSETYEAMKASGNIVVNGKSINNSLEEFPLIIFRDVTYFPLTWRFAVTEFGWDYSFTNAGGLVINSK